MRKTHGNYTTNPNSSVAFNIPTQKGLDATMMIIFIVSILWFRKFQVFLNDILFSLIKSLKLQYRTQIQHAFYNPRVISLKLSMIYY